MYPQNIAMLMAYQPEEYNRNTARITTQPNVPHPAVKASRGRTSGMVGWPAYRMRARSINRDRGPGHVILSP
jgi:hypothetical protein